MEFTDSVTGKAENIKGKMIAYCATWRRGLCSKKFYVCGFEVKALKGELERQNRGCGQREQGATRPEVSHPFFLFFAFSAPRVAASRSPPRAIRR
jgi:hypothetical protein